MWMESYYQEGVADGDIPSPGTSGLRFGPADPSRAVGFPALRPARPLCRVGGTELAAGALAAAGLAVGPSGLCAGGHGYSGECGADATDL